MRRHWIFSTQGYATGSKTDVDKAFALMKEMARFDVKPDLLSYNTLLNACAMAEEMGSAKEVFVEMLKNDVEPDDVTVTTLAKGTLKVNTCFSRVIWT